MVKQGSCAFKNVSDILEVAVTNGNSFKNHLTAILPLLVLWYIYFLYVVVWLIYVTFVQLFDTHEVIMCHCYL
jgi:fatty acid desaturase